MYGGSSYGATTYGGTGSAGNLYTLALTDTITATSTISRVVSYLRTMNDTIITSSTITAAGMFARTLSDTISSIDNGISRLIGKNFSLSIGVTSTIRRYLNGLLVNNWTKVVKTIASFFMTAKPTATYTKTSKSEVTGIWTKVDKPE